MKFSQAARALGFVIATSALGVLALREQKPSLRRLGAELAIVSGAIIYGSAAAVSTLCALVRRDFRSSGGTFARAHEGQTEGEAKLHADGLQRERRARAEENAPAGAVREDERGEEVKTDAGELSIESWPLPVIGGMSCTSPSTGVRITHLPTGIVVTAEAERSQHKNKAAGLAELDRLLQLRALDQCTDSRELAV